MSSRSTPTVEFGRLAKTYDHLRPVDEQWFETVARMVELGDLGGRTIVDVGCGTGRLGIVLSSRYGARVTGVDPSPEMLAVAREKDPSAEWVVGRAESLPFEDEAFARGVAALVVHHLERDRALPEVARVLESNGRFVISTPDPIGFPGHWLAGLFPSFVEIERARFPDADTLERELAAAGFVEIVVERRTFPRSFSREFGLERLRGRYGSMFDLITPDEYEAGLERAAHELPDHVSYVDHWLLVVGAVGR
jgi:SAM-dependent methyltransferase